MLDLQHGAPFLRSPKIESGSGRYDKLNNVRGKKVNLGISDFEATNVIQGRECVKLERTTIFTAFRGLLSQN